MPVLHIILAEKLGLNVHLSTAPLHMFVRYTNPQNQRDLSIEPTSGGYPTRDVWYRENLQMTNWRWEQVFNSKRLTNGELTPTLRTRYLNNRWVRGEYKRAFQVGTAFLINILRVGSRRWKMGI